MVYDVGIYEAGKYKAKENGRHTKVYLVWRSMIARCYSPNYHGANVYENVMVCEDWKYFQRFAEWFDENYYEIPTDTIVLDKDFKSFAYGLSKQYSPENCIFIPQVFNKVITFQHTVNHDLPVGVKSTTSKTFPYTYDQTFAMRDKDYCYRRFKTKEEAYEAYLDLTYRKIKFYLDIYGDKLPQKSVEVIEDFIKNDALREMHKMQHCN